jgi:hypothetical protein
MQCVSIRGQGVAASCCAHLLNAAGFPLSRTLQPRPRVPAIVVGLATQTLVSGVLQQPGLFDSFPRLDRRIVAWGPKAEPVVLPHSAVVLPEEALLGRIDPPARAPDVDPSAQWTVFASRPLPEPAGEHHFGSRHAAAVAVELKAPAASACWIESLDSGWLFLIPGWLIAVGGAPETLLAGSRLVADQIRSVGRDPADFPAYPRIADPLCDGVRGHAWLACGTAAMAFDPICGDGAGNAVREAILAAAVIRAATRGETVDRLLAHYRSRLIAGFRRHLELSLDFYRAANGGPWWKAEMQSLARGVAWCADQLAAAPGFHYRLEGFDLLPATAR